MAEEYHMNLSQFICFKVYSVPTLGTQGSKKALHHNKNYSRPWEFDTREIKNKKGRKLPLIPGTPQWRKAQLLINRVNMINELKEKLTIIREKVAIGESC
ncbi:MAG: hypothetical protein ACTSWY_11750 [Promethearchaeota archaeon]